MRNKIALLAASLFAATSSPAFGEINKGAGVEKPDPFHTINAPTPIEKVLTLGDIAKLAEREMSGDGFDYGGELVATAARYGMYFDTPRGREFMGKVIELVEADRQKKAAPELVGLS